MKYNIKINEVKGNDTQVRGFATVTFGDCLLVRNIAIVENRETGALFVSMPSHRTNDVNERGEPIYRDICNPITKEFYDEFTKNILDAYENRANLGRDGVDIGTADKNGLDFTVKVSPMERDGSSLRGIGRIFIEDSFVIGNVKLIDGKNGMFLSMPDYKTDKIKDGKPVYRGIVFPVTKEFREGLYDKFEQSYNEEKSKKLEETPDKAHKAPSKSKTKEKEPEKAAPAR